MPIFVCFLISLVNLNVISKHVLGLLYPIYCLLGLVEDLTGGTKDDALGGLMAAVIL